MRRGISARWGACYAAPGPTHKKDIRKSALVTRQVLQAGNIARQRKALGLIGITVHEDVPDAQRSKMIDDARRVIGVERAGHLVGLAAGGGAIEDRMQVDLLVEGVLVAEHLLGALGGDDRILDEGPGGVGGEPAIFRSEERRG